ncbi:tRNA N(3)-cytidine methyltransferase METTL8, mitochondrial [Chanos chanos]|uniref:tRNA N(3)-cytidine methyltransferase METTL8, mitochondrial n=1 Tax=Chanos chanos TaxID=29144 RepID=A0A6J2WEY3_CHACN|nr:methyltransferase-like protein 8 [Chanos chanos]
MGIRRVLRLSVEPLVQCLTKVPHRLSSRKPPVPLGARLLTNPEDIFQNNMWDHVQWTVEESENARLKAEENSRERIPMEEQVKYDRDAHKYWDGFYGMHQNKFFKNRTWLFNEFPELFPPGCVWREAEQETGSAVASETGSAVPSETGSAVPGETGSAVAGETGSAVPSETGSAVPGETGGETQGKTREAVVQQCTVSVCEDSHCHTVPRPARSPGHDHTVLRPARSPGHDRAGPGEQALFRILEVGCGAGNSVFPIIRSIKGSEAFLYCCDFSPRAVQLLKEHPEYDSSVCHAFVHDVCEESVCFPFPPLSLDVILLVFVLSAIHPQRVQAVVRRLALYLKPGGVLLFRDYGRHDLSQLRFKKGQCLSDNFYTRQDGTCAYFFTKDEVRSLFTSAGLEEVQNLEDRRLQVNRRKKLVMRRVWIQSKFRKPHPSPLPA